MFYCLYVWFVFLLVDLEQNFEVQVFNWVFQDVSGDIQVWGIGDFQIDIEQILVQNVLENVLLIGLILGDEVLFCVVDIFVKQSWYI